MKKPNVALNHDNFDFLELNFNDDIINEDVDLGSITLLDKKSGRGWSLDISDSKRYDSSNIIISFFEDLEITKGEMGDCTNDKIIFDLTLEDLHSDELSIEMFYGEESTIIPFRASLHIVIGEETIIKNVIIDNAIIENIRLLNAYPVNVIQSLFKNNVFDLVEAKITELGNAEGTGYKVYKAPLNNCTIEEASAFFYDHIDKTFFSETILPTLHILTLASEHCFELTNSNWIRYSFDTNSVSDAKEKSEDLQDNALYHVNISDPSYASDEDEENNEGAWVVCDTEIDIHEAAKLNNDDRIALFKPFA
jgi:hypothetical protein